MKVLHITSWYPTADNPKTALWVERHINALKSSQVENTVYHVEVSQDHFEISLGKMELLGNRRYCICVPFFPWFLIEFIATLTVALILRKERGAGYDIINFHIAYPNLTYWHWIKKSIKIPVVITEHWSAYHYHFGIRGSKKLEKIKRIFNSPNKIITVSEALQQDIINFSGNHKLNIEVVPNIVDTEVFYFEPRQAQQLRFFMVSQWKYPKDPFTFIKTFKRLKKSNPDAVLRIGGYGTQESEMVELISELELGDSVFILGKLNSQQIAEEMRLATGFIHLSGYETFSVVCAEAICCGCPVLASDVGGIKEFINDTNGVLINIEEWGVEVVDRFIGLDFDREAISRNAHSKFSSVKVGDLYYQVLSNVCK